MGGAAGRGRSIRLVSGFCKAKTASARERRSDAAVVPPVKRPSKRPESHSSSNCRLRARYEVMDQLHISGRTVSNW